MQLKNSKILVIGGAGFIGSHLVAVDLKLQGSREISKQPKKDY